MEKLEIKCPFETEAISCDFCGGIVNVYPAGDLTEVHCNECGAHYMLPIIDNMVYTVK